MQAQLEKTDKGYTVLIPDELVLDSRVRSSATVDLSVVDGKIVIAPIRRSKYTTEELLAGVTDENIHGEIDLGASRRQGSLVKDAHAVCSAAG